MLLLCRVCYGDVVMCYTLILWERINRLTILNYSFSTKNRTEIIESEREGRERIDPLDGLFFDHFAFRKNT